MKRDKIQPIGKNPATASSRPHDTDLPAMPVPPRVSAGARHTRRSGGGRDTDRANLGSLDARPEAITDAEVEVGPRGGCHAGGH